MSPERQLNVKKNKKAGSLFESSSIKIEKKGEKSFHDNRLALT